MTKLSRVGAMVVLLSLGIAVFQRQAGTPGLQLRLPSWVSSHLPPGLASTLGVARPAVELFDTPCHCGNLAGLNEPNSCHMSGTVVDCCCSYSAVEQVNRDDIGPILDKLVQSAFFRYFKVDLYCDCPFWPDDGMCAMRDCSVCECEEDEVPKIWRAAEGRLASADSPAAACAAAAQESALDRTLQPDIRRALLAVPDWRGYRNPWMPEADDAGVEYAYINLQRNPERFTGYAGEHAARVWQAIYGQPGLEAGASAAPELRVFYRLISGLHASISAHLVAESPLRDDTGEVYAWGPDLAEFRRRLGSPELRDRVENLYFAYLFVLRAVQKAAPLLRGVEYSTGLPEEDAATQHFMHKLLDNAALQQVCPIPFDEGRLWRGEEGPVVKEQLRATFQNITRVMDCVGCEKCKMWGKLQFLGVATSLKILFSAEDCSGAPVPEQGLQLERNEVIALVNLLERLSNSVETVRTLSVQLAGGSVAHPQGLGAIQDVVQHGLAPQLRTGGA
uniref:Endoplasmic oxidoreductin-1 n=2 Tax=Auxenochlorella protothecoides TaxID=3075 RepID=A0A1D1ZRV9_AUXPR